MIIGIDIDSTINRAHYYDIIHGRELCKKLGITKEEKPWNINVKDIFGFNDEEYNNYMLTYFPWNCKYNKLEPGAQSVIKELYDKMHDIYIITARDENYDKSPYKGRYMKADTIKWFAQNNIPYNKLIFSAKNKAEVCKANNVDVMIDDDPKHILECSEQGIPTIIAAQSYNENLIGTPNTYYSRNWFHTLSILKQIEYHKILK